MGIMEEIHENTVKSVDLLKEVRDNTDRSVVVLEEQLTTDLLKGIIAKLDEILAAVKRNGSYNGISGRQ